MESQRSTIVQTILRKTKVEALYFLISKPTTKTVIKTVHTREFPGIPVIRTLYFHCQGPGSTPRD